MAEGINNFYADKKPPYDNDAEQMVLSCMIFPDDEGIRIAAENLTTQDFYSNAHKLIFEVFIDLYNNNKPVDFILAKEKLETMGYLDVVGGIQYLIDLSTLASTTAKTKFYVDIIKKKAILRNLVIAGSKISEYGYEGKDDVDTLLANAEKDLFEVAQNRKGNDFTSMDKVMAEVAENIHLVSQSDGSITGIATGFKDFDKITSGLQKSDLVIIAGRPAMGKTTFAINIAQYAAVEKKVPVAIFSLEMSKEQLGSRMLSSQAMVDSKKIREGRLNSEDFDNIAISIGELSTAPIEIYDAPDINPTMLREKCRRLQMEKGLGLIVIDYMQLMNGTGNKSESDQQRVSFISRSLKGIARELDVPVIALSQLSRSNEARQDKRPMMSDLRESGAIEQDADLICLLFREEYYKPNDPDLKNKAEVIIAKHRKGSVGTVNLTFLGEYTKFEDATNDVFEAYAQEG